MVGKKRTRRDHRPAEAQQPAQLRNPCSALRCHAVGELPPVNPEQCSEVRDYKDCSDARSNPPFGPRETVERECRCAARYQYPVDANEEWRSN
jgi:hypothetical protein